MDQEKQEQLARLLMDFFQKMNQRTKLDVRNFRHTVEVLASSEQPYVEIYSREKYYYIFYQPPHTISIKRDSIQSDTIKKITLDPVDLSTVKISSTENTTVCSSCGELMVSGTDVCPNPHCGQALPAFSGK